MRGWVVGGTLQYTHSICMVLFPGDLDLAQLGLGLGFGLVWSGLVWSGESGNMSTTWDDPWTDRPLGGTSRLFWVKFGRFDSRRQKKKRKEEKERKKIRRLTYETKKEEEERYCW